VNITEIFLKNIHTPHPKDLKEGGFTEFLENFIKTIKGANTQLLSMEEMYFWSFKDSDYISLLEGIKFIHLNYVRPISLSKVVPTLLNCTTLKLEGLASKSSETSFTLLDLSPLKNLNIQTLKLQYKEETTIIGIRDCLDTVRDLELVFVNINDDDILSLANKQRLSLKYCNKVKNIMPLVNIPNLTINSCKGIRHYAPLINQRVQLKLKPLRLCLFVKNEPSNFNIEQHITEKNCILIPRK
jgi:hypothetical protein